MNYWRDPNDGSWVGTFGRVLDTGGRGLLRLGGWSAAWVEPEILVVYEEVMVCYNKISM